MGAPLEKCLELKSAGVPLAGYHCGLSPQSLLEVAEVMNLGLRTSLAVAAEAVVAVAAVHPNNWADEASSYQYLVDEASSSSYLHCAGHHAEVEVSYCQAATELPAFPSPALPPQSLAAYHPPSEEGVEVVAAVAH